MEILTQIERKNIDLVLSQKNEDENYLQKVEVKGKKARKLFILIGNNRIFFFKVGGKLEFDYHLLDILELRSDNPKEITIKLRSDNGKEPLVLGIDFPQDTNEIIFAVDYLFSLNFPTMKSNRVKIVVLPESRQTEIFNNPVNANMAKPEMGSCGGFTLTYFSMCDFMNIQPINEVNWHVDNILAGSPIKEFDYGFFYKKERLIGTDAKPIMAALAINQYFTSFSVRGIKLSSDCLLSIISMLSQNTCFEKLVLNGVGLDRGLTEKLVDALQSNKALPLKELDLGDNAIEDKGMLAVVELLKNCQLNGYQLRSLVLSNCSAGKSSMLALCECLASQESLISNLKNLDISQNRLENDGSVAISNFLGKSKALTHLNLSNGNPQFHQLKVCKTLTNFDSSGNKVEKKHNVHRDMINFLNHSIFLTQLNLSKCSIPVEIISDLFGEGNLMKLESLNVSDNDLGDEGVSQLCDHLSNHPCLRALDISGNFIRRSKARTQMIESIINLLEKKSKTHYFMRSIVIQGGTKSQLKGDLLPVVCSLYYNNTLKEIDISGHAIGDILAAAIGKLLQVNSTLEKLHWDDNGTTHRGLSLFKIGLARNQSLLHSPLPMKDIASSLKSDNTPQHLQKMTELCTEIQQLISNSKAASTANGGLSSNLSNSTGSNTGRLLSPKGPTPNPRASTAVIPTVDPKSTIISCAGLGSFNTSNFDTTDQPSESPLPSNVTVMAK
ncbi:hypothetical protein DLAC_05091 [Tieghemostelium lacteum]|uniref:Leucine-rich repeat-containing protein (LRR) n=1 Tax=Tieghemostelium lacteum TaxID=361077 RepID=A0A151ZIG5_TIELA|nr:hypothetical protein DLAC_05091 [Tieghemostelium lacteum]|eukprot:KYQ93705.1 hypothetical protein DLAC_05091 [Tieghemostelium lacteum]